MPPFLSNPAVNREKYKIVLCTKSNENSGKNRVFCKGKGQTEGLLIGLRFSGIDEIRRPDILNQDIVRQLLKPDTCIGITDAEAY